jgi:hypothetical protein
VGFDTRATALTRRITPCAGNPESVNSFGVFAFLEFLQLYATLPAGIGLQLDGILSLV